MDESNYYHAGELAIQKRAYVRREAEEMAKKMILPHIPLSAHDLVSTQRIAIAATVASGGNVWASAFIGDPGFLSLKNEHRLEIASKPIGDDPAWQNLCGNPQIGVLILDPTGKKRLRVNGHAEITSSGISIAASLAFTNCKKFIQCRVPIASETNLTEPRSTRSTN